MDKGPEWIFLKRRYTNGQKAHEKCSSLLIIREIHIKTKKKKKRYHLISVRMAIIKRQKMTSVGKDVEKGDPCALLVGM